MNPAMSAAVKLKRLLSRTSFLDIAIILAAFIFLFFNSNKGNGNSKSIAEVIHTNPTISAPVATKIVPTPTPIPTPIPTEQNTCNDLLVLVNKQYALPSTYQPPDLVYLADFGIPTSSSGLEVRAIIIADLQRLFADAKRDGISLVVVSPYRSYATQELLHNNYVQSEGETAADASSALPGHSQHQLGTAIDFGTNSDSNLDEGFGNTAAGEWLAKNAYLYGFYIAYPANSESITGYEFEPWHYRYIGVQNALNLANSGMIMELYLEKFGILPNC